MASLSSRRLPRNPSRTNTKAAPTVSSTTAVFQAVSRNRRERKLLLSGADGITSASHGLNQRIVEFLVELAAQAVDVHLDHVGGAFPIRFPKMLAEHLAR